MKELNRSELIEVNGGTLPSWFKNSIWVLAATYLIDHWADLKAGIVDGCADGARDNQ